MRENPNIDQKLIMNFNILETKNNKYLKIQYHWNFENI